MTTAAFGVRLDVDGDVTTLWVAGEIDMATADHVRAAVSLAVTTDRISELVIDLAGASFCDSTGLSALVNAHHRCAQRNVTLILRRPTERMRQLLTIAGLDPQFTIKP